MRCKRRRIIKGIRRRKRIMKKRRHLLDAWNLKRLSYWVSVIPRVLILSWNNYVVPTLDGIPNNVPVITILLTLYILYSERPRFYGFDSTLSRSRN
jgi:hypothetical protein